LPIVYLTFFTFFYSVPIFGYRAKSFLPLKNLHASISWWLIISVSLAFYIIPDEINLLPAMMYTLHVFFIVYIIELLWDIRDIKGDKLSGNKTFPSIYGVCKSKLFLSAGIIIIWFLSGALILDIFFFNLVFLLLVTIFVREDFPAYYFHGVIYGEIVFISTQIILLLW